MSSLVNNVKLMATSASGKLAMSAIARRNTSLITSVQPFDKHGSFHVHWEDGRTAQFS